MKTSTALLSDLLPIRCSSNSEPWRENGNPQCKQDKKKYSFTGEKICCATRCVLLCFMMMRVEY
jgi:hypothetical protein